MQVRINRRPNEARERLAYQAAQRMLEAGEPCADCKEKHLHNKAVGFVLHSPEAASFLCQYHLDIFLLKQANLKAN